MGRPDGPPLQPKATAKIICPKRGGALLLLLLLSIMIIIISTNVTIAIAIAIAIIIIIIISSSSSSRSSSSIMVVPTLWRRREELQVQFHAIALPCQRANVTLHVPLWEPQYLKYASRASDDRA